MFCDSFTTSFQNNFRAAYLSHSANLVLIYVHRARPVPWHDPIPRPSEIMKASTTRDWINTYVYPRRSIPFLKHFFTIQSYQNIPELRLTWYWRTYVQTHLCFGTILGGTFSHLIRVHPRLLVVVAQRAYVPRTYRITTRAGVAKKGEERIPLILLLTTTTMETTAQWLSRQRSPRRRRWQRRQGGR